MNASTGPGFTFVVMEQSRGFLDTYRILRAKCFPTLQIGVDVYVRRPDFNLVHLWAPSMTCVAFAAELAIKAGLTKADGGKLPGKVGHNLEKLYSMLSADVRKAIEDKLNEKPPTVAERLAKDANAFEQWRYSYEKGAGVDEEFLERFTQATLDVSNA